MTKKDLTKINKPFGQLGKKTQMRLLLAMWQNEKIERMCPISMDWNALSWADRRVSPIPTLIYRLKPTTPEFIEPTYPWAALAPGWDWCAIDKGGEVYAYVGKPDEVTDERWCTAGIFQRIDDLFAGLDPGTVPWDQSLRKRPT